MPMIRPSAYSDKDLQELCDTLADTENAVFIMTSVMEERYGKLRPGKREQKLITACEKIGYSVQIAKPNRAALQAMAREWAGQSGASFAPGAEAMLLDRCGEDQFLLHSEIEKLAALADYGTITPAMIQQLGTVTLDADTFDMVRLVSEGADPDRRWDEATGTLLELQNDPILITGALIFQLSGCVPRLSGPEKPPVRCRAGQGFRLHRQWNYRLNNADQAAARYDRRRIERSLQVLQQLDLDLKGSRLLGGSAFAESAVRAGPADRREAQMKRTIRQGAGGGGLL